MKIDIKHVEKTITAFTNMSKEVVKTAEEVKTFSGESAKIIRASRAVSMMEFMLNQFANLSICYEEGIRIGCYITQGLEQGVYTDEDQSSVESWGDRSGPHNIFVAEGKDDGKGDLESKSLNELKTLLRNLLDD